MSHEQHGRLRPKGAKMIIGIGTDILEMSAITPSILRLGGAFLTRVYSPAEIEAAQLRANPHSYYATRFAGKEAVFKALGLEADKVSLNEIELLSDEAGRPAVRLLGRTGAEAAKRGVVDVQISLARDDEFSVAFAIAQNAKKTS